MWLWTLTIPDWRPDPRLSINGRRRLHHYTEAALSKDAKERVQWAIRDELNQRPTHGWYRGQMLVVVTLGYQVRRRRDPDNCAGLIKPLADALVAEGLLADDDSEHIRLEIRVEVGGADYTRIDLAERSGT